MQIVSIRDNLHEMSNPVSGKNKKTHFSMSRAENFTQNTKRKNDGYNIYLKASISVGCGISRLGRECELESARKSRQFALGITLNCYLHVQHDLRMSNGNSTYVT